MKQSGEGGNDKRRKVADCGDTANKKYDHSSNTAIKKSEKVF
jgi:hypothetical protein